MEDNALTVDAVHTNLFRLNMFMLEMCLAFHDGTKQTLTHAHTHTEGRRRCDGGMEQVRKWIDNLFTVLRRYASHRAFYHRFEVISKFAETLFVCSVFLHNTKIRSKANDGHILCEFSSLLVFSLKSL